MARANATTPTGLRKRRPLLPGKFLREHPAARAFLAPQRDRPTKVQYPKPRCGMCGGKVHTKTDYHAPAEVTDLRTRKAYGLPRKSDWWLCPACDTGAETGMPRAA